MRGAALTTVSALALALACATQALAAPTRATIGDNNTGTATSNTIATTGSCAASTGDYVIAMLQTGGAPTGLSATDTAASPNTYSLVGTFAFNSTYRWVVYSAPVGSAIVGSTTTIKFAWTGGLASNAFAYCATGLSGVADVVGASGAGATGSSTSGAAISPAAASGVLAQASELLFGVSGIAGSITGGSYVADTGDGWGNDYTPIGVTATVDSQVVAATTSVNDAPHWAPGRTYGVAIFSFEGSGGAPPPVVCSRSPRGVGC